MSDIWSYLKGVAACQETLRTTVSLLGHALEAGAERVARGDEVVRLDEIAKQVCQWQNSIVFDLDTFLLPRHARAWVVIGSGGIPDDVDVVTEGMSLMSGKLCQPDLEGYRMQGKTVLAGNEFLELVVWLKSEVLAGRVTLPYHPPGGTATTIRGKRASPSSAEPGQNPAAK
jgi:hypothetical protein